MRFAIVRSAAIVLLAGVAAACAHFLTKEVRPSVDEAAEQAEGNYSRQSDAYARELYEEGRDIFRYDTFGSEAMWGDKLELHKAILGEKQAGIGPGLTPKQALTLGLKVDVGKLPRILGNAIRQTAVSLENPETTVALLRADSVVGVKGVFEDGKLKSVGITCAICHSTVNNSFADGIGRRLDGWPNRDLDIGAIAALAPGLKVLADALGANEAEVRRVLKAWGPGRYDAEFNMDGKGFRPDGKTAATVLPAAFGLAGVNLHTYGGWGIVTHWNAYVANTQMYGQGTFYDPRLNDREKYPLAVKSGLWNKRSNPDLVTAKLPALHYYQLSLPAPKVEEKLFDKALAQRGESLFLGKARCAQCHVPPIYTEPGWNMHSAADIGIDDFQSSRAPDRMYRTTPLRGLSTRSKGGFYHDGRFATLADVVAHYDTTFTLRLSEREKRELAEFLKSL
jgi:hypothetical protein